MISLEKLATQVTTDVLVLGGGMGGLCAAIKASEKGVTVVVVDKGGIGWAGQVPLGGGSLGYLYPEQVDTFCQWVTEYNHYLNNQEWTYQLARGLTNIHRELCSLGVPFLKKNGDIAIVSLGKDNHRTKLDAPRAMLKLKRAAVERGVKMLDKVFVADLLVRDGKVLGAIGFGLLDGRTYILSAKSVVIAMGTCRFQAEKEFSWTVGEGQAMAYRAGAQLMNAEFRNFYLYTLKGLDGKQFMAYLPLHLCVENALGDSFADIQKSGHAQGGKQLETDTPDALELLDFIFEEVRSRRGPVYLNLNRLELSQKEKENIMSPSIPPGFKELYSFNIFRLLRDKLKIDPMKERVEIKPLWGGGSGVVRIDCECRTTIEGLWAAGDVASCGSSWSGSRLHVMGGTGIGFAAISGFIAGKNAGKNAVSAKRTNVSANAVYSVIDRVFSPLRQCGRRDIREISHQVHEAVVPMKYSFKREAGRMREALGILEIAKKSLNDTHVRDNHELALYYQAESMILAGELTFKAALRRQESRGQHIREDFPSRDDKNWLKWIVINYLNGKQDCHSEDVPIAR